MTNFLPGRRGTRAQASLALVIMILVACIGAGAAYFCYVRMDYYQGQYAAAKSRAGQLDSQLRTGADAIQQWKLLTGVEEPGDAQAIVDQAGFPPPNDSLKGMIAAYESSTTQLKREVATEQTALAKALEDLAGAEAQFEEHKRIRRQELARVKGELEQARSALSEVRSSLGKELSDLRNETREVERTLARSLEDWSDEERNLKNEIAQRRIRLRQMLEFIRAEQIEERWDIDAHVLHVDSPAGSVGIDRGRRDGVRPAMTFEVLRVDTSGVYREKGWVRIRTVEDEVSFADVIEAAEGAPVVVGDLLRSPLFPPGEKFVVIGFFPRREEYRYTFEEIEELIRRFGGEVSEDVTVRTDYVILGTISPFDDLPVERWLGRPYFEFMEEDLTRIQYLLGRQLVRFGEDRLKEIADHDMVNLNLSKELRVPQFTLERFLRYLGR